MQTTDPKIASKITCSDLLLGLIVVTMANTISLAPEFPVPLLVSYPIIIGGLAFMGAEIVLYFMPDQILIVVINLQLFSLHCIGRSCFLEDPLSKHLMFLAGCAALIVTVLLANSDRLWTPKTLSGTLVLQIVICGLWML